MPIIQTLHQGARCTRYGKNTGKQQIQALTDIITVTVVKIN